MNTINTRQRLSKDLAESLKPEQGGWFILHAIFRSKAEYCASLTRGRSHNNDNRPLKVNRWGYQIHPSLSSSAVTIEWERKDYKIYKSARRSYFRKLRISRLIVESRIQPMKRYIGLKKMLRKNPSVTKEFSKALAGTNLAIVSEVHSATSPNGDAISTTSQQSPPPELGQL